MADDEAAKRAAAGAAFQAWRMRPRDASREEIDRLWLALWDAADFSWDGLADAGWDLGYRASEAQKLKRWRAPADLPGDGAVHGEGETAWKEATLQDYWRGSIGIKAGGPRLLSDEDLVAAGLLTKVDGTLWHVLHRPEVTADITALRGSAALDGEAVDTDLQTEAADKPAETGAPDGGALAAALLARLEAATSYAGKEAPDNRVHIRGPRAQGLDAVWRAFGGADDPEARKPLHLSAPLARFDRLDASALTFGDRAGFGEARFGHHARFDAATFGDGAGFYEAQFGDRARFNKAQFGDRAGFGEATFGDDAGFNGATFGDDAGFGGATFGDNAGFNKATFGDRAGFSGATFGDRAGFSGATFGDRAGFSGAAFGNSARLFEAEFGNNATFSQARFGDEALFVGATFGASAGFFEATFGDDARFAVATFESGAGFLGATFGSGAGFFEATFGDDAGFHGARFGESVQFEEATFCGRVVFYGLREDGAPTFAGAVSFKSARFEGPALFGDNSTQPGARFAGRTSFRTATFEAYADFSRCAWPERAEDQHAAFEGARFRDVADFNSQRFTAFALFDGADFQRPVRLADPRPPNSPNAMFKAARTATRKAIQSDRAKQGQKDYDAEKDPVTHERGGEARWRALAGGFRTLKLAMQAQSDHDREQRFYRYELRARMRQPSTPVWERIAAWLYGLSSDDGTSIIRPFVSLAVLITGFTALYWGAGQLAGVTAADTDIAPALDFALSQTFRPLGIWWGPALPDIPPLPGPPDASLSERLAAAPWRVQLAHGLGQAGWTSVKFLATIQSFFSIVLLFLFALAVRRRFQIS